MYSEIIQMDSIDEKLNDKILVVINGVRVTLPLCPCIPFYRSGKLKFRNIAIQRVSEKERTTEI